MRREDLRTKLIVALDGFVDYVMQEDSSLIERSRNLDHRRNDLASDRQDFENHIKAVEADYQKKNQDTLNAKGSFEEEQQKLFALQRDVENNKLETQKILTEQQHLRDGLKADREVTQKELDRAKELKEKNAKALDKLKLDYADLDQKTKDLNGKITQHESKERDRLRSEEIMIERERVVKEREIDAEALLQKLRLAKKRMELDGAETN